MAVETTRALGLWVVCCGLWVVGCGVNYNYEVQ
jgi:hypothetical protein